MKPTNRNMKAPILITGAARSGASMIAGVINICGAFGGDMFGPSKEESKKMFRNGKIFSQLVQPYLRSVGADPEGQFPLPDEARMQIPIGWREKVERVILDEGYQGGPWMYKDSELGLMWKVWDYAFPDAKWIVVRRKTSDIVYSCTKTTFMRAFKEEANRKLIGANSEDEGWLWWVHEHEKRFSEMITDGVNCKVVWPERMVNGDYAQMYETIEWLGLKWNSGVLSFIDPKLWKARILKRRDDKWPQEQQPPK